MGLSFGSYTWLKRAVGTIAADYLCSGSTTSSSRHPGREMKDFESNNEQSQGIFYYKQKSVLSSRHPGREMKGGERHKSD